MRIIIHYDAMDPMDGCCAERAKRKSASEA